MKTLSAMEVRRKFGKVLDLVAKDREVITICRANKPLAVLVPADEFTGNKSVRAARLQRTVERIADWRRVHRQELAGLDPVRMLRESRESR
jgi:prevent-host-death family protein